MQLFYRLQYHYAPERVTADERVYSRDGPPQLVQIIPHAPKPPPALLAEEHQALLAAERDCLQVCPSLPLSLPSAVLLKAGFWGLPIFSFKRFQFQAAPIAKPGQSLHRRCEMVRGK